MASVLKIQIRCLQVVKLTEAERQAAAVAELAAEEAGSASDSDGEDPPGLAGIPGPPSDPNAPPPPAPAQPFDLAEANGTDPAGGHMSKRKKRAGRSKYRAGEGESIILRDELAGPMRSAGPIRTAADMHRSGHPPEMWTARTHLLRLCYIALQAFRSNLVASCW